MDNITKELRRKIIKTVFISWAKQHPAQYAEFKTTAKMQRETSKNKYREFDGGDETFFSHFAEIPQQIWDHLTELLGLTPRFLDDFEERDWFARQFPELMSREGKGAIHTDSSIKLRPDAKA